MSAPAKMAPAAIDEARELVTSRLRDAVSGLSPTIERVVGYHYGWADAQGQPTGEVRGKLLRASLVLLSARAAGATTDGAVPGAVAVELVHGFSLLHDDVMDGDTERRHQPAAWTVFGTPTALLAGDALLALAMSVLLDAGSPGALRALKRLTADLQRLVAGQCADLDFERRCLVSLDECLSMTAGKTGALMACSAAVGAELVEAPRGIVSRLARYGEEIGVAYQCVDDWLGIWGSPEATGKPALSDLRSRKKSLPVVAAMRAGTPASRRLGQLYLNPDPLSPDELGEAATLIEAAGGKRWVEQEAARRAEVACRCLEDLPLSPAIRAELVDLAEYVTERSH